MKRLLIVAAGVTLLVVLLWKLLLMLGVTYTAARFLHGRTAGPKRRRPKASWPKIIEAVSLASVAWSVRHINGGKASVTPGFTLGLGRRLRKVADDG